MPEPITIRECAACHTVLRPSEHIGVPYEHDEITGLLRLHTLICENCMKKYARQALVDKSIRKVAKDNKAMMNKCVMVYGKGKNLEVLVLDRVPKDVMGLFMRKPYNTPFVTE